MLERFAGRAVSNPILLVLVEVQHSFEYGNENTECTRHPHHSRKSERRQERDGCCGGNLNDLHSLKVSLVGHALSVIPTYLIFESLHNGIDFGSVRGFSAHGLTILTLTSHLSANNFAESHALRRVEDAVRADHESLPTSIAESIREEPILAGLMALLVCPTRLLRSAIVLKPSAVRLSPGISILREPG
jgi:hypothetical protein